MYPVNRQPPAIVPAYDAVAPFADPFADIAATVMPISVPAMLRHSEFFSIADTSLRSAYNRIASYFLTDVKVDGELGEDEKKSQKEYLVDRAGVIEYAHDAGISMLSYGNHFTSVFHPIVRYVVCPGTHRDGKSCGSRWRLAEFDTNPVFQWSWRSGIHGYCPNCGHSGMFHDVNRPPVDILDDAQPIIIQGWNPHDIRIVYNEAHRRAEAFDWVIPAEVRTDARMGYNRLFLRSTPWDWIMAAIGDQNIRFTTDMIHHWREPTLAGIRSRGFGIPRAIVAYRQIYYSRILARMNEVLAMGHVVPMRVISPANTTGRDPAAGDILKTGYLGNIRARVNQMIANWRADPSSVQFAPIALQFQSLGADARNLIPADIINQSQEQLLNGVDVPVDFYRSNLTTQNAPTGLRLIEATWAPYVRGLNSLLRFIGDRAQFLLKWPKAEYSFKRVTLVDSIEKSQLRVQMVQAGLLARSTGVEEVDEDFEEQARKKLQDQRTEARIQQEFEDENDAYAFGKQMANLQSPQGAPGAPPGGQPGQPGQPGQGQPQPGGDPSQQQQPGMMPGSDPMSLVPSPGANMDPTEFVSRANQVAETLLGMAESQRFSILQNIRKSNEWFHQMVRGQMDQKRSQARSQGGQQMMQQRYGGGQGQ